MSIWSKPQHTLNNPVRAFWILVILISACSVSKSGTASPPTISEDLPDKNVIDNNPEEITSEIQNFDSTTADIPWHQRVIDEMTLREKIAQMIMPFVLGNFAPEGTDNHDRIVEVIEKDGVGGVIMSVGVPTDVAVKLNDLQRHSKYPLLVGADLETGAGFRFWGSVHVPTNISLGGATIFPSLMGLGATRNTDYAYQMGRITALEAKALGVHLPFAPVLDVNNNNENPIILSIRLFLAHNCK